MDRAITIDERRKRGVRRMLGPAAAVAVGGFVLLSLPHWLRPSVSRARVRLATVDRGPVEATTEASGTVVPASERALSSPIEARIERVLKHAGDSVNAGEAIVALDTSASRLETDRLEDRLARKRNEQEQLRIALERSLSDLSDLHEKARLDQAVLISKLERDRKLRADGLVSEEAMSQSENETRKGALTVEHLAASMEEEKRATAAKLEGTALDLRILDKELAEAKHRLALATASCDESGVVTWVVPQAGASVARGEVIARVARLDAFRVEATVSDVHTSELRAGLPVWVMVDETALAGTVASVLPAIENGAARFLVDLDQPASPLLRQNLRVDVFVVTGRRDGALRVPRGPFVQNGSAQEIYVVEGDRAVRRTVRLGIAGREWLEVTSGLAEHDQVIVSDMQDYLGTRQIALK
jgi:HlyD family secretion protein